MPVRTKRLEYVCELLAQQVNHWTLFPVMLTVAGLAAGFTGVNRPNVGLWAMCALFPPVFFFLREKVKRFTIFTVTHFAAAALALVFPVQSNVERAIAVACGVLYLIFSYRMRLQSDKNTVSPAHPISCVGLCAPAVFLQNYRGVEGWEGLYVTALVATLALYVFHSYIRHYLDFLSLNGSSAGCLPAADMFRSGISLVGGYTLFGAVVLVVGTGGGWVNAIWVFFRHAFVSALRFLFSLLFRGSDAETMPLETALPEQSGSGMPAVDSQEPFILWRILETLLAVAVVCCAAFLAVRGVLLLVRFVRSRFQGEYRLKASEMEGDAADVREKCGLISRRNPKPGGKIFEALSPAARIRRLYKRKILSAADVLTGEKDAETAGRLGLLTARECGRRLDAGLMADVYEKVRYSNQEPGRDTVRQMKAACRGTAEGVNAYE